MQAQEETFVMTSWLLVFAELGLEYPGTADGLVDWDEFFEELPGNIIDALSKIFGGF